MAADSVKQGFALPRDKYGTPVPVMTPDVANIVTASLTTSSTAEAQVHNGTSNFVYRVWSIGCAAYVRFGATGMAAASSSRIQSLMCVWSSGCRSNRPLKGKAAAGTALAGRS